MPQKILLDGKEYDLSNLSDNAKGTLDSLKFVTERIRELNNIEALLNRARTSYMNSLKAEMVSNKAGLVMDAD